MSSRKDQKSQARQERLAREAKLLADTRRKRLILRAGACVAAVAALTTAGFAIENAGTGTAQAPPTPALRLTPLARLGSLRSPAVTGTPGPEGVPVPDAPALAGTSSGGRPVDGIQCLGSEQLLFHIHAHLTVYVRGAARQVPAGIGIDGAQRAQTPAGLYVGAGRCFYWLHTHAADGIIHIESPIRRTFTLGDFFDVWGQRLGRTRVGQFSGRVTAIYDGRVYEGDPRDIPLIAHAQIQLEIGKPLVSPVAIDFPAGL
jgi:hypothetical protein